MAHSHNIVPIKTTLPREEAWQLDDLAQMRGVRRSHILRAMVRYVMSTHAEDFMAWVEEEQGKPAEAVEDPTPEWQNEEGVRDGA